MKFFLSVPLRFKITIPYLIAATLLAGLASYQVARSYVVMLEDRFRGQLEDASFRVADGILAVEQTHLTGLRAISFTTGFPQALAERDLVAIDSLAAPQVTHNGLYFVDVLDSEGNPLRSWHRFGDALEYENGQFTDYQAWHVVQNVLNSAVDELGDKYTEIVETPWGFALYTAGPVIADGELAGALLVGSPLDVLIRELATSSLSNVTLYNPAGVMVVSTLGTSNPPPPLDSAALAELASPSAYAYTRKVSDGSRNYVEAVDRLYLREQPSGWYYGVALPASLVQTAGVSSLLPLLFTFVLGIIVLFLLGVLVAQIIAIPIFRLLTASQRVGRGDFSVQVDAYANDEIGQLTHSFNRMVNELHQREFVREMFGRMVSRDVSEAVLQGKVALGGEEREVTVLFTDVRGFTSLAEKYPPNDVIALLNQFFAVITAATSKNHGVINYFGGDSVLAVFGAPIERPMTESLRQAIYTALEIRKGVVEINAERISREQIPLRFGVGINSGTVVAGNIGTEERFHYTVIGDVVNIAARLQGASRQFPRTPLLIPESSIRLMDADSEFEFQPLGELHLKGKEKPVSTYAVTGIRTQYPPDFTIFDHLPYPRADALLACHLYCKGYSNAVIAEALDVALDAVEQWLEIAAANAALVGQILVDHYGQSKACLYRLQDAAAPAHTERDQ